MHNSFINYGNMLTLYRDNPQKYHTKEKYKYDIVRPGFLGEENKPNQSSFLF